MVFSHQNLKCTHTPKNGNGFASRALESNKSFKFIILSFLTLLAKCTLIANIEPGNPRAQQTACSFTKFHTNIAEKILRILLE